MKENGLTEMDVFEAEIETDTGYFWCSEFDAITEKNDYTCGRWCEKYKPRNGKSGRCIFNKNCYDQTEIVKHLKLK
jgi:hypothetical protein